MSQLRACLILQRAHVFVPPLICPNAIQTVCFSSNLAELPSSIQALCLSVSLRLLWAQVYSLYWQSMKTLTTIQKVSLNLGIIVKPGLNEETVQITHTVSAWWKPIPLSHDAYLIIWSRDVTISEVYVKTVNGNLSMQAHKWTKCSVCSLRFKINFFTIYFC